MEQFQLPTFHINGTSAKSIFDEYIEASRLIRKAHRALSEATCNGRDFNSGPDYYKARDERQEMLNRLDDALTYCDQWVEHAADRLYEEGKL